MLITLKTLQEDDFTVEIDPQATVRAFKEKIEKVKGENFPAKFMKLLYGGKYLLDNDKICDCNLEEKKCVIAVVKKPKAKDEGEEESSALDGFLNGASNSSEHEQVRYFNHERLVQRLTELGFSREEVEQALHASSNNLDQAIDFLISNVVARVAATSSSANNEPIPDIEIPDIIELHNNSQSEYPYPPAYNSILPSQERILELVNEAVEECDNHRRADDQMIRDNALQIFNWYSSLAAMGILDPREVLPSIRMEVSNGLDLTVPTTSRVECSGSNSELPPDRLQFLQTAGEPEEFGAQGHVLDRDQAAINRLKQLGFSEQNVTEAYFVCDKNENAAADYLFNQYG